MPPAEAIARIRMVRHTATAMLATLAGCLALLLGLAILLLPLLALELSRPRDSAWGALVLLLGLVLVTSADRLSGAPMLAVICGGLLTGRLGQEVAQGRWRQLSDEERQRLGSVDRWSASLQQLSASLINLLGRGATLLAGLQQWLAARRAPARSHGKRWVRPESEAPELTPTAPAEADLAADQPAPSEPAAPQAAAEPEPMPAAPEEPEAAEAAEAPAIAGEGLPEVLAEEIQAVEPAATAPAAAGRSGRRADPDDLAQLEEVAVEIEDDGGPVDSDRRQVSDFGEIDALLQAAVDPTAPGDGPDAAAAGGEG